ncbi:MAG: PAS domain S-box protein [Candidatus Hermodarchaeia archaeon]|jgi:PAS domain S-box-containing protein
MRDDQKTKAELLRELEALRHRVAQLEKAECKRAEETLRESEEKYRSIFNTAASLISSIGASGVIIDCNARIKDVLGYERDEVVGQSIAKIIHPDYMEKAKTCLDEVLTVGIARHKEYKMVRKDNKVIDVEINAAGVRSKQGKYVESVCIIEDITERMKAKQVLAESEEKFRTIFDNANDIIASVTKTGKILEVNKKIEDILGYKPDELVGKNILTSSVLAEKNAATIVKLFKKSVKRGGLLNIRDGRNVTEVWTNHKDGHTVLLEANTTTIKEDGKLVGYLSIIRDITESKKAQEALRESEEKYREIVELAPDGIVTVDLKGIITSCNSALLQQTGYTKEDFVGKHISKIPTARLKDIPKYLKIFSSLLMGEVPKPFEFIRIHKDGSKHWGEASVSIMRRYGKITGFQTITKEITERKKTEEALRESEEKYRKLFEETTDAIFVADAETGTLIDCNSAAEELVGREKSELVGKHQRILHPPEETEGEFNGIFKQHMKEKDGQVLEAQVITKKGKIKDVEIRASCLELQGKQRVQGIFRDVTEPKRAEEALRDSESKYRTLVENLPQKIFLKDKNSVYVSCNDNFAKDLKIKSEEITGKTDYDFFPKALANKYRADDKRIIELGETKAIEEKYIVDGEERIVHTVKTPVKDEKGNVTGVLGIFWDITELKRREEELNIYRDKMVQAEHLASVGTLSASLAHELTQPLTVISLSIENSLAELEKTSCPDTVVEGLKEGLSEVSSITSMVNRFRNFARRSSEEIKVAEVDLKGIAERSVKLLDENAWRAKVTLRIEGMDKLPVIYSQKNELERLFYCLVENAIQAADGKYTRQVTISGVERDEHIELRFSDNCGGIAPGNLKKIFQPFFTTRPSTERTGLGLCVVERILSRLDGKVRVESEFGKGSIFFVTLPINKDEE